MSNSKRKKSCVAEAILKSEDGFTNFISDSYLPGAIHIYASWYCGISFLKVNFLLSGDSHIFDDMVIKLEPLSDLNDTFEINAGTAFEKVASRVEELRKNQKK